MIICTIAEFASSLDSRIYVLLFFLMFLNSSIMMPPSEYICIAAGILAFNKEIDIVVFIVSATAFNLLGTYPWYLLGIRNSKRAKQCTVGAAKPHPVWKNTWLKAASIYTSRVRQIEHLYQMHGIILLVLLRNIPVIRSIASYPAGKIGMSHLKFTGFSYLGILIWVFVWTLLGYQLGHAAISYTWHVTLGMSVVSISLIVGLCKTLESHLFRNGQ